MLYLFRPRNLRFQTFADHQPWEKHVVYESCFKVKPLATGRQLFFEKNSRFFWKGFFEKTYRVGFFEKTYRVGFFEKTFFPTKTFFFFEKTYGFFFEKTYCFLLKKPRFFRKKTTQPWEKHVVYESCFKVKPLATGRQPDTVSENSYGAKNK